MRISDLLTYCHGVHHGSLQSECWSDQGQRVERHVIIQCCPPQGQQSPDDSPDHCDIIQCCPPQGQQSPDDSPDLVERFVGMLFGKKALESREPMGMKRLSAEDAPEMFPATLDEWADPVDGDSPEVAIIRPLLAGTRVRALPLRYARLVCSAGNIRCTVSHDPPWRTVWTINQC